MILHWINYRYKLLFSSKMITHQNEKSHEHGVSVIKKKLLILSTLYCIFFIYFLPIW